MDLSGSAYYSNKCNEVLRNKYDYTIIISLFIWIMIGYIDCFFRSSGTVLTLSMGVFGFIWVAYGIIGLLVSRGIDAYKEGWHYLFGGPVRWFQCAITYYYIRKYNKSDIELSREERNRKINKIIRGW